MSDQQNTITVRIPLGPAYAYVERTGTIEEVAGFLNIDTEGEAFQKSPFAAIAGIVHAGELWARKDYANKGGNTGKA